jgi:hypothetical protein
MVNFTVQPLYPWERVLGTLCIGGWVGPRAGLDTVMKRKIPSSCLDSNPPIIQSVARRYITENVLYSGYLVFGQDSDRLLF